MKCWKKWNIPTKFENNRTKPGNPYYLVLFESRTKPGTVVSETVLSGDSLSYEWLNMALDESSLHLQVLSEVCRILISRYTVTRWHLRERPPYCAPQRKLKNCKNLQKHFFNFADKAAIPQTLLTPYHHFRCCVLFHKIQARQLPRLPYPLWRPCISVSKVVADHKIRLLQTAEDQK